jgi:hypothetical protein
LQISSFYFKNKSSIPHFNVQKFSWEGYFVSFIMADNEPLACNRNAFRFYHTTTIHKTAQYDKDLSTQIGQTCKAIYHHPLCNNGVKGAIG